jgi:starch synthase
VSVYLPRYKQTKLTDPATVVRSITVPFDDKYRFASVVTGGSQAGVRFYFVEYPEFFDRDALYGTPAGDYPDNAERFALFSRAVLEATKILGVPHVFHCHDWQSALVPVLLRTVYAEDPAFRDVGTVFHHPQHRLPRTFPAGDIAAAHAALGSVHHVEDGILRAGEFSEGRAHLF